MQCQSSSRLIWRQLFLSLFFLYIGFCIFDYCDKDCSQLFCQHMKLLTVWGQSSILESSPPPEFKVL